ncbi:MAG: hypothetical protein IPP37_06515 [Saprospiraceae bacterium]|nr:hypothetical protein [Saprospiraceae bacterium]
MYTRRQTVETLPQGECVNPRLMITINCQPGAYQWTNLTNRIQAWVPVPSTGVHRRLEWIGVNVEVPKLYLDPHRSVQ